MNVEKYIQTKQKVLKEFELFWNAHKNDSTFPEDLSFSDWEEQEEFFERTLEEFFERTREEFFDNLEKQGK